MADVSTYPLRLLRLPKSLKEEVSKLAKRDGTSVNQFIAIAVAEKISALETEEFFSQKMEGANLEAFKAILFRSGGEAPRAGDEMI